MQQSLSNRGLQLNPHLKRFEITFFVADITSVAAVEGSVKLFSIEIPVHGFTHTTLSMFQLQATNR